MDTGVYGPPLSARFTQSVQSDPASKHSDLESDHHSDPHSEDHSEQLKGCVPKQRSTLTRKNTRFGQSTIRSRLLQYAEEVETFRQILELPDPGRLCLGPYHCARPGR